jgi:NADH-quinone oxidoreductase subunit J
MEILTAIFGLGAIISGFLVITASNPIHSVLNLVITFANASVLLLIMGIEFLSLLFIIVYVGAIAILFLFVVMMLNINITELTGNAASYVPIGFIIGIVFLSIIKDKILLGGGSASQSILSQPVAPFSSTDVIPSTNISILGDLLYTNYFLFFLMAGILLFVAILGAIILTL